MSRRTLLRLVGGASLVAVLELSNSRLPQNARAQTSASSWTIPGSQFDASGFTTEPINPDQPFTALSIAWQASFSTADDALTVEVSTLSGDVWSEWIRVSRDPHVPVNDDGWRHLAPVYRPGSQFRLRLAGANPESVQNVRISALNTDSARRQLDQDDPPELIDGFIIPREGWGADESFRHLDQEPDAPIAWPPSYQTVRRIIVHHTATEPGWEDPAAMVRAIYYYHAVILGWGDIGYNYLIDWQGNVYEGRFGGPNVVGGHAYEFNPGSMGVAIIGDYTEAAPIDASIEALTQLIQRRAPHVDVTVAEDWLNWGDVPNLLGHGDVIETSCPGAQLDALLPYVRGRVAGADPIYLPDPILLEAPKILDFSISPTTAGSGDLVEIRATITNEGRDPLQTQGPDPGFIYDETEDYESAGFPKVEGAYRLVIGSSRPTELLRPYRWGFGAPLQSGEVREIVGYIRMKDIGQTSFEPAIIKEYVQYFEEEERRVQTVHVVHPLVRRAEPINDPDGLYFEETGHNVPAVFANYWLTRGGLVRFGFPLTEPFEELSETDGFTYLTQYFERARFEWHPEYAGTDWEVQLGLLGSETTADRRKEIPFQPIEPFESTTEEVYFPETGHSTSYRFLAFWRANGGVPIFGYPISEKFEEISNTDGKVHLVQYFERNRFEWHPDDPNPDQRVKLGHLAREILIERGWIPGVRRPVEPDADPDEVDDPSEDEDVGVVDPPADQP